MPFFPVRKRDWTGFGEQVIHGIRPLCQGAPEGGILGTLRASTAISRAREGIGKEERVVN
jgi:hypothetical protein